MGKSKWPEIKEKLPLIEKWARDGLSQEQISKNLGISHTTMSEYKSKYPEMAAALSRGREVLITEVENALIKRALGFKYEEVETYVKEVAGVKTQMIKKSAKYCPPDVGACAFVLKNRDKDNWTDNPKMLELKHEMLKMQKQAQEMETW